MRLPIGESNFKNIMDQKLYWVDKSLLIQEILGDATVILITRPRRFGKTLNMSMLHHFFAKEAHGQSTAGLFEGLKIMQKGEEVLQHYRKYPVIFLTFKDIKESTFEVAYEKFCIVIQDLYCEHEYLLNSHQISESKKVVYRAISNREATYGDICNSLKNLSYYLFQYHGIKPIILIDEYDTPIQSGYLNNYYELIIDLFRSFFSAALKDNPYLFKAVLTGILRISRENLFSGLNNLRVYSVLQSDYGAYFGFIEEEVSDLLEKSRLQDKAQVIKEWYNGYQIGQHKLYNPWSIVNCIQDGGLAKRYWVNTSDNSLVKEMLLQSGAAFKERFSTLMQGDIITYRLNENFVFSDLKKNNEASVWTLLLMAGYLKTTGHSYNEMGVICQMAIPNYEVRGVYRTVIEEWLANGYGVQWYAEFLQRLLDGNIAAFEKDLAHILEKTVSVHDVGVEPEAFYHGLMIGLTASLYGNKNYETKSNRESGNGRYDLMIFSHQPDKPTLLFEFKKVDFPKERKKSAMIETLLDHAAQTALTQIEQQAYFMEAKQKGAQQIINIGIAFCGKRFRLASKVTNIYDLH